MRSMKRMLKGTKKTSHILSIVALAAPISYFKGRCEALSRSSLVRGMPISREFMNIIVNSLGFL